MKPLGSVAAVVAAVREDAQAEVDAVERDATEAVARFEDGPGASAPGPEHAAAIVAARERARTRIAQEDWEDTRAALDERESWIAEVEALGRKRLLNARSNGRSYQARQQALVRLAVEGISRLPSGPVVIVVTADDAALLDETVRQHIERDNSSPITVVTRDVGGGCIIQSADGRAVFDNTYDARIDRLQAQWRSSLLDLYEGVTARVSGKAP